MDDLADVAAMTGLAESNPSKRRQAKGYSKAHLDRRRVTRLPDLNPCKKLSKPKREDDK